MRYQVGINPNIIGKPGSGVGINQATGWECEALTIDEMIDRVAVKGHAFSAQFKNGYRRTPNFVCSSVIAADFDSGLTLRNAQKVPFIRDFASFIYTTPSHSRAHNHFRVVFLVDEPIEHADAWANALFGLALKLESDTSIKDAGRQFYGCPNATVVHLGNTLPSAELARVVAVGHDARARRKSKGRAPVSSSWRLTPELAVRTRRNEFRSFSQLEVGEGVFCPYHNDEKASAFVVKSNTGGRGVHCMACDMTFWPEDQAGYDFDAFERLTKERSDIDSVTHSARIAAGVFEAYFPPEPSVVRLQKKYLPRLHYQPGITLVRSPKGSGKTEAVRALVQQVQKRRFAQLPNRSERPRTILLIGHRQSLLREAARRLGLSCYLDWANRRERENFAVCLDSLPSFSQEWNDDGKKIKPIRYDLVIIDESEQVFSHLLSDTIKKGAGIYGVFLSLCHALSNAKAVYALDADLGLVTAHGMKAFRPDDWERSCRIIYNEPPAIPEKRVLHLFKKRDQLERKMLEAIRQGKRCFITTNRKSSVEIIKKMIAQEFGDAVKLRWVTSKNSQTSKARALVENIQTEFLKCQVLVCSPSLGTGIDITFPDGRQEVDHVFGFFFPFINTHTDIDQQLARVRNPGEVSAWVSETRLNYETSFDVIQRDIATSYFTPYAAEGLDSDGRLIFKAGHPLLAIQSHVVCARRASMKRLRDNFIQLRVKSGWKVIEVDDDEQGTTLWESARKELLWERIEGILSAADLTKGEVSHLKARIQAGERISDSDHFALRKAELQRGVAVPLTRDIVALDADGRVLERVAAFDAVFGLNRLNYGAMANSLFEGEVLKPAPAFFFAGLSLALAGLIGADGTMRTDSKLIHTDLHRFVAVCHTYRTLLEEVFGFPLAKNVGRNPVKQLNRFLKVLGLKFETVDRRRRGGKATFSYRLDLDRWRLMCELAGVDPATQEAMPEPMELEAAE